MRALVQNAVMRDGMIQQLAEPHTIYDKPSNRFVAGFIGSPSMSFLAGTVNGNGGEAGDMAGLEIRDESPP